MPEYLAPGVYIEEVSFRSKSIEGVSTSTTGFVGPTRFGPTDGEPELITNFNQFERIYGGLDQLEFNGGEPMDNYMAHAVRAFFDNGGSRLYVARTFSEIEIGPNPDDLDPGIGRTPVPAPSTAIAIASTAASNTVAAVRMALQAATEAAGAARNSALAALNAALEHALAQMEPAPDTSDLNIDATLNNAAAAAIGALLFDPAPEGLDLGGSQEVTDAWGEVTNPTFDLITSAIQARDNSPTDAAREAAIDVLRAAFEHVLVAVDPTFDTSGFDIDATLNNAAAAAIRAMFTDPAPAGFGLNPADVDAAWNEVTEMDVVARAITARDGTGNAITDINDLLQLVNDAISAGHAAGDNVDVAQILLQDANDTAEDSAGVPVAEQVQLATEAEGEATSARETANSAANLAERADDLLYAAGNAVIAAEAALRAAIGAVGPGTVRIDVAGHAPEAAFNAARDARIALRVAQANAVGFFEARFPGEAGNFQVTVATRLTENVLVPRPGTNPGDDDRSMLNLVQNRDLVVISRQAGQHSLFLAQQGDGDDEWAFINDDLTLDNFFDDFNPDADHSIQICTFTVEVRARGKFDQPQLWDTLTIHPERRRNGMLYVFGREIRNRTQELETPLVLLVPGGDAPAAPPPTTAQLISLTGGLIGPDNWTLLTHVDPDERRSEVTSTFALEGGNDGERPSAHEYEGESGNGDPPIKSGLKSFEDLEEISIVAAPGLTFGSNGYENNAAQATQHIIAHCERMLYRVAVLDSYNDRALSDVRADRAMLDSTRAALYYPWVRVMDPITEQPIHVPPSGFVTGIYARTDVSRGVHKAPANEVVLTAIGMQTTLNKAQQDVLNPRGINCLRFFENRGIRVWGARTLSSDPEWKYVNIRRYFAYLERSIEVSTQWAVFEPNGEALWNNVRGSVDDFLYNEWASGRLAETDPSKAYFVRCDRSTMTQNDLDNGRMICLIGVAPLYPAEFVIFRIGQWTADSRRS